MGQYSDFTIIPIGDYRVISYILKELNVACESYPFELAIKQQQLEPEPQLQVTNIIYNLEILNELNTTDNIDVVVQKYIGDAFDNNNSNNSKYINKYINSANNLCFPYSSADANENREKYKSMFIQLKQDLNKKNMFVLFTRRYYIEQSIFEQISNPAENSEPYLGIDTSLEYIFLILSFILYFNIIIFLNTKKI
jgi:hypothetical protein